MISYDNFLSLFFGSVDSPEAQHAFEVESFCSDLMSTVQKYLVSQEQLRSLTQNLTESRETAVRGLSQLGFSGNHNSNKDVSAFFGRLQMGITLPVTEKGNVSITQEWLRDNLGLHPSIELLSDAKRFARQLSTLESLTKSLTPDGYLPVTWRTYSETGSPSFSSDKYAVHLLPHSLKSVLQAPKGLAWFKFGLNPIQLLQGLAKAAGDSALLSDLAAPEPFQTMGVRMGVEDSLGLVYSLIYGDMKSLDKFTLTYEGVGVFLDQVFSEASSTGVISSLGGRKRKVDPTDNLWRSVLRAFISAPATFKVKELLMNFSKAFYAAGCFILPDADGFYIAFPSDQLEVLENWVKGTYGTSVNVSMYGELLG